MRGGRSIVGSRPDRKRGGGGLPGEEQQIGSRTEGGNRSIVGSRQDREQGGRGGHTWGRNSKEVAETREKGVEGVNSPGWERREGESTRGRKIKVDRCGISI